MVMVNKYTRGRRNELYLIDLSFWIKFDEEASSFKWPLFAKVDSNCIDIRQGITIKKRNEIHRSLTSKSATGKSTKKKKKKRPEMCEGPNWVERKMLRYFQIARLLVCLDQIRFLVEVRILHFSNDELSVIAALYLYFKACPPYWNIESTWK